MTAWPSLLTVLLFAFGAGAADPPPATKSARQVELGWDDVAGASSYELELTLHEPGKKTGGSVQKFKSDGSSWAGLLEPGHYQMRVRAKDARGVGTPWSEGSEITVMLPDPGLLQPRKDEEIKSDSQQIESVEFVWQPVDGASAYRLHVLAGDNKYNKVAEFSETHASLKIPVAKSYTWWVEAIRDDLNPKKTATPAKSAQGFVVFGKELSPPTIYELENEFVRKVSWQKSEYASHYSWDLQWYDPQSEKWISKFKTDVYKNSVIAFPKKLPGGKYRLAVQAKAPLRVPSSVVSSEFPVRDGDRSAEAESALAVRDSIKGHGFFVVTDYSATAIQYKSQNLDSTNSSLKFSTLGGSARFGLGSLLPDAHWGYLGFLDAYAFELQNGGGATYFSGEFDMINRRQFFLRDDVRQLFGVQIRQTPDVMATIDSDKSTTEMVNSVGLHYGIEYWYAVNAKTGAQFNAQLYPSVFSLSTPSGALVPTLSYQVGIMLSRRLGKKMRGMIGYVYREDSIHFRASNNGATATASDVNTIDMQGNNLNFILEWEL